MILFSSFIYSIITIIAESCTFETELVVKKRYETEMLVAVVKNCWLDHNEQRRNYRSIDKKVDPSKTSWNESFRRLFIDGKG